LRFRFEGLKDWYCFLVLAISEIDKRCKSRSDDIMVAGRPERLVETTHVLSDLIKLQLICCRVETHGRASEIILITIGTDFYINVIPAPLGAIS